MMSQYRNAGAGRLTALCLGLMVWGVAQAQTPTFTDVTTAAELSNPLRGRGLAWGDYNGDGKQDVFITAWTLVGGAPINKLWKNDGDGTFTNVAATAQVQGFNNFTSSAAWGDFNNDGQLDLYVTNFPRDEQDFLYQNNGSTFSILLPNTVKGNEIWSAWGDYNLDGNLDLAIARFNGPNILLRNNGTGTFTDVSATAGINDVRDSERVCWVDYDSDGDPDLFVVNIYHESRLFKNKGDGTFEDVTATARVGSAGIGRHCAWGDYDNDGDMDLYTVNIGRNILFENNGDGTFRRLLREADQTGTAWVNWMGGWADYNLDGHPDLFVASGAESADGERDTVFRNNGDGSFTDVTVSPFTRADSSSGAAWADYDSDGDADLYVLNYGEDVLYRNDTAPNAGQAFLKVKPLRRGKTTVSDSTAAEGIGAKIWVFDAGTSHIRGYQEIISGPDALEAIFGLPTSRTYDVKVQFTSRTGASGGEVVIDKSDNSTKYGAVSVPQSLTVREIENTVFP
ncbi:MAG: VCBS repeat-containing protein [candidate division Zixibacteria bacterium]|nr:VCBS repeat-containing protein [candidate division Zixibacteria bacterium]